MTEAGSIDAEQGLVKGSATPSKSTIDRYPAPAVAREAFGPEPSCATQSMGALLWSG